MNITETEMAITESEITKLESYLGCKLPSEFISHYLKFNGGFPDCDTLSGKDNIFSIDGFLPIKHGALTIESLRRDMAGQLQMSDFIPFANDAGGNIFVINLGINDYGNIYLVAADTGEVIFVCSSFSDFLNGMG